MPSAKNMANNTQTRTDVSSGFHDGLQPAPVANMDWNYETGRPRAATPTPIQPACEVERECFSHSQSQPLVDRTLAGFIDESSDESEEEDGARGGEYSEAHHMDLRMREFVFIDPTTIDRDESGDYDPKARTKPKPSVRRKKIAPAPTSIHNGQSAAAPPTGKQIRQGGFQYILGISFSSKSALKRFKVLAAHHGDNWPEYKPLMWDDSKFEFEATAHNGYALRARRTDETKHDDYYLRNTPAARMCRHCYETGDDCSMLRPNGSYPCESCMDNGEQCVMLVDPKRKASCESCRSDKMPCSYVQHPDADHRAPCVRCEKQSYTCVAGPAWDPLRTRIGIDGKPATPRPTMDNAVITYTRKQKTCAPCRRHGYWCSLVDDKRNPVPPCAHCKRFCTPCTFEAVPASEGYTRAPVRSAVPQKRKSKKEREEEASAVWVRTMLSHPIKFLCSEPDQPNTINCHWCLNSNTLYSIYGHGKEQKVRVLEWPNGAGYEELEGGHVADGHESSRMCVRCTGDRHGIMTCSHSDFKQIADIPAEGDASAEELVKRADPPEQLIISLMKLGNNRKFNNPEADGVRKEVLRWCSMCPNPAQWACCALKTKEQILAERNAIDPNAVVRAELAEIGCSLRLCWACKHLYSSFFQGNFSEFVSGLTENAPEQFYPNGLRADASLLAKRGLLEKYLDAHRAGMSP